MHLLRERTKASRGDFTPAVAVAKKTRRLLAGSAATHPVRTRGHPLPGRDRAEGEGGKMSDHDYLRSTARPIFR
jgi:hypothetical protein